MHGNSKSKKLKSSSLENAKEMVQDMANRFAENSANNVKGKNNANQNLDNQNISGSDGVNNPNSQNFMTPLKVGKNRTLLDFTPKPPLKALSAVSPESISPPQNKNISDLIINENEIKKFARAKEEHVKNLMEKEEAIKKLKEVEEQILQVKQDKESIEKETNNFKQEIKQLKTEHEEMTRKLKEANDEILQTKKEKQEAEVKNNDEIDDIYSNVNKKMEEIIAAYEQKVEEAQKERENHLKTLNNYNIIKDKYKQMKESFSGYHEIARKNREIVNGMLKHFDEVINSVASNKTNGIEHDSSSSTKKNSLK
ncbi:MAG: hypothetical protein JWM09_484 [Francisellaceae bacterium]|nr:hypothetical protein [Francisellaceae bacterium]